MVGGKDEPLFELGVGFLSIVQSRSAVPAQAASLFPDILPLDSWRIHVASLASPSDARAPDATFERLRVAVDSSKRRTLLCLPIQQRAQGATGTPFEAGVRDALASATRLFEKTIGRKAAA
jgi:hypothetical protein